MAKKIKADRLDYPSEDGKIILTPVGIIHSPLSEDSEEVPFQSFTSDIEGDIEIFKGFEEGLEGIEGFSHLFVIFYMHKWKKTKLRTVPLMEDEERGIFGTRSPSRPNHLGASTVRLLSRKGNILHVKGLDIFDGTPVLDIKPYVPKVDLVQGVDNEWLIKKLDRINKMGKDESQKVQKSLRED
ncbi:MAG: tRNA (N6-threonylcarbamoyladenosine(37)-N6)-methyltransferase TrmO [Thermoplasmata archaeon]|nr:tRNA (N6-threonylcarbamoyladenosine(37)-N6)-methyltransferase TrmO [Thermoplasmata archaeon]